MNKDEIRGMIRQLENQLVFIDQQINELDHRGEIPDKTDAALKTARRSLAVAIDAMLTARGWCR